MKAKFYEAPLVEIVEVELEHGIAQSSGTPLGGITDFGPDPDDELW